MISFNQLILIFSFLSVSLCFSSLLPVNINRQWRHKEVIEWGPNDETVIYNEFKKYIFKPELSDDWDQEITTINPVVAVSIIPLIPSMRQNENDTKNETSLNFQSGIRQQKGYYVKARDLNYYLPESFLMLLLLILTSS